MIKLRDDLVLIKQVEDRSKKLVLVGGLKDDGKKYHHLIVVQVGKDVTRCKVGDRVFVGSVPIMAILDAEDTGMESAYGFLSEAAIYAVEAK